MLAMYHHGERTKMGTDDAFERAVQGHDERLAALRLPICGVARTALEEPQLVSVRHLGQQPTGGDQY
jgi:hypothetical protein